MKVVFADTFYWIAITVPRDEAFHQAQIVTDSIVTTEEVLTEYLAYFAQRPAHFRRKAVATVEGIMEAKPDKGYSLADCISMQTMKSENLTAVLTNDRHFAQEGFRALFRA